MSLRHIDGLSTYLRAPDGVGSGVPTTGGELSHDQGLALFGTYLANGGEEAETPAPAKRPAPTKSEDEETPATAGDGDGADDESELAEASDDASPEDEVPGETDEESVPEAEELPPIAPPRSWTKEDKADFAKLPRESQERIADRERSRETDFLRRQQEATSKTKAVEAKEQAAEQARQQYEDGVKRYSEAATQYLDNTFADIKTFDDVRKLATEDPIRFNEWNLAKQQHEAAQVEQTRIAAQRQAENSDRYRNYVAEQQKKFLEVAPEFADPAKAPQLQAEVREMLVNDYSLTPEEIKGLWVDGAPLSVHDWRFQKLIADGLRFRKAQKAVASKPAPKKPVAPVQQPGPAPQRGEERSSRLKQINTQLDRTGGREAGLALIKQRLGS